MTNTKPSKKRNGVSKPVELRNIGSISLNKWQEMHLRGEIDVYAPIPQEDGGEPLPPLAVQWKEDAKRRFGNANTRNR